MDLMICGMCGVQYSTREVKSCKICDDPRQYVPPDGYVDKFGVQQCLKKAYKPVVQTKLDYSARVTAVQKVPKYI